MEDPIVRCAQCTHLVHLDFIHAHGACQNCGSRRVQNVTGINSLEMNQLRDGRYDFGAKGLEVPEAWLDDWAEAGTFTPQPMPGDARVDE